MFKFVVKSNNCVVEFICDNIADAKDIKRFVLYNGISGESVSGSRFYLPPARIINTNIIAMQNGNRTGKVNG